MIARTHVLDPDRLAPALLVLGTLALAVRPTSVPAVAATALVGVTGILAWGRARERASALRWTVVVAAGVAAFLSSLAMGTTFPAYFAAGPVVAVSVAALAEEAFFRRFMYGWLERREGAPIAVAITAILFALIHLPIYGVAVMPLDLAAGALLGWQRWATGTWTAPLVTHLAANLVQFL
jgi:membrane protease YdiL (CAAX protease family)